MNMQGKARAEIIGRGKMSGKREQGKVRAANISGRQDHGKAIKFRAPGAAREAGATRTGGAAGAAGAASSGIMPVLVGTLLQPILYFSKRQRNVIVRCGLSALGSYADHLPGWIPAYIVAGAPGFNAKGIDRAVEDLQGRPYVWATEFENVHTTWEFSESEITVQGTTYSCMESFYHAQKPVPFDQSEWLTCHVAAMRVGLRQKFLYSEQSKDLLDLLMYSHPYPLRSLKRDCLWGFQPEHGGEDMLAKLLVEIREEAVASRAVISQSGVFDTQQNLSFSLPTYNNLLSVSDAKNRPARKG